MRFYQKLPKLFRKGGDLDLLVADKYEEKLKNYLSRTANSYYILLNYMVLLRLKVMQEVRKDLQFHNQNYY